MVASCTWEKRPSITQPLKSRAGEVVEDGGGWGRLLRDAPPPAFPNLLRPPPTSGAVAPSIPKIGRASCRERVQSPGFRGRGGKGRHERGDGAPGGLAPVRPATPVRHQ